MLRRAPAAGLTLAATLTLLVSSHPAAAQPKPPAPKPPAQAAAPATTPTVPSAPPSPIAINDPMLAPIPPPPRVLAGWKDALAHITTRSIDVAVAFQEIEKAEGQRRIALARALGSISAAGTINGQLVTGQVEVTPGVPGSPVISVPRNNPTVTGSITATLPLVAPQAWYGIKTADMALTSSRLSYDDKRRTVLVTVANSIISVITAERVAEINRNGLKSALERLDLTQRKFRLGDATRLDVLRAEQDAQSARATLVTGDESLRQAREALGLSLGYHEAFGVPPGISLNEIEGTISGVCAPGKLEDRADIRKAKNDIEVAHRGITDAWLAFAPTLSVSSTASITSSDPQFTSNGHPGSVTIQGTLTIPLWDGGARYGNIRVARATAEQSKITLEATMRSATIGVAQSLRAVSVAEQSRAVSTSNRDLARESARLAQRAYEVGTGTSFDLVNTAQQERAAELDLAVKEFQVVSARLSAILAAANCTY